MAVDFLASGRARRWEHIPQRMYIQSVYGDDRDEDPTQAVLLAETESADLAYWLVSAINACIAGVLHDAARCKGRVLQHGSFRVAEDEFLNMGWYYCVAWDAENPSGVTVGRSKDFTSTRAIADPLEALVTLPT